MIVRARAARIVFAAMIAAASGARAGEGDRDGDGVPDNQDVCPDTAGPKSWRGCPPPPDRDRDHVPDATDLCPDKAGLAGDGCPLYQFATIMRDRIALGAIVFVPKRARILPQSFHRLDDLAHALRDNRRFEIIVVAHAETPALAKQRAAAVRAYLMKHHVPAKQLRTEAQGPPAANGYNVDFIIARRR